MNLTTHTESILFASNKPVSVAQLKKLTHAKKNELDDAIAHLQEIYAPEKKRGMVLAQSGDMVQLVTHPDAVDTVSTFLKADVAGELTEPSLETLTIVAYRGPLTKPEIEQIRGVNCSLILRNLLIRGLIEKETDQKLKMDTYSVTIDFLKFLGITRVTELPEYATLHSHETLDALLRSTEEEKE